MNTMDENNKSKEFFIKFAFNITFRSAIYKVQQLKELDEEAREVELTRFRNESQFLHRRGVDYGFYRFTKREMARKRWLENHIKTLGYLILLGIFHPEQATTTIAQKRPRQIPRDSKYHDKWFNDRFVRRIRSYYPEIFFIPLRDEDLKRLDARKFPFSTVFSDMSNVDKADRDAAMKMLKEEVAELNPQEMLKVLVVPHESLEMVEPDDILVIQRFGEYFREALKIIKLNFGYVSELAWLYTQIEDESGVFMSIYHLIENAISLRTYRVIKSESRKIRLLQDRHPLRYSRKNATLAVKRNMEWLNDTAKVANRVFRGAAAYAQLQKFDAALYLYRECLAQLSLDVERKGLCYQNIANVYRMKRKPRNYLIWLLKALKAFQELDSSFHMGITWALKAEAYFLLNKPKYYAKYNDAVQQSKKILSECDLENSKKAEAYLYVVNCVSRIDDLEWERETIISGLKASAKLENKMFYFMFQEALNNLESRKNIP